jgi:multidrug efflux system outer membrane protein
MRRSPLANGLRVGATTLALLLASCMVGPGYSRPCVDVPTEYRDVGAVRPDAAGPDAASIADVSWWEVFRDPALVSLIHEALGNSQNLAAALARVAQARASLGVARGDLYPQIDLAGDAARTRASGTLAPFGGQTTSFPTSTTNNYRVAAGATWEIDLWGRVRRGAEAAWADYLQSEEGRRAAIVALVGDVAAAYFDLLELDSELSISRETRTARQKTIDLFRKRVTAGASSELESAQAAADLAVAEAAIPELERRITLQENLIALLVGRLPGPVTRSTSLGAWQAPPSLPAGLPSDLLERRPDVREAEDAVRAANARIGVATANMLPTIDLAAFFGFESGRVKDLLDARSKIASIGGSLTAPIFHGGALSAERCRAIAARDEAIANYRQAVQDAFRDVSDQLISILKTKDTYAALRRAVDALKQAVTLSSTRYDTGLASYFEVLDAQRRLYEAQIASSRALRDRHVAVVRLYRALGGGWQ